MKSFFGDKPRILIWIAVILLASHLAMNGRYKLSVPYQAYRCVEGVLLEPVQVPALYKPFDFRVDFYGMIFEGRSGNLLDDAILYYGASEKSILFFLRDTSRSIGSDAVFVDIGANVGQHSLYMSKHAKIVHAFEPYPPVIKRFKGMIALNQIQNIVLHEIGLGSKNETVPFFAPPEGNLGAGSFLGAKPPGAKEPELQFEVVRGDDEFLKGGITGVDLVKLDIEGFEKQALLGLARTLEANRPIVVMELNLGLDISFQGEEDLRAAFPSGYRFLMFAMEDWTTGHYELIPLSYHLAPSGAKNSINIVAYPEEKKSLVSFQATSHDPGPAH